MRFDRIVHEPAVRVAVIDSGIDAAALGYRAEEISAARFALAAAAAQSDGGMDDLPVRQLPPVADRLGHGTEVARLILAAAPGARLLNAQVFADGRAATAAVAAAIDWAVAQGAQLINLSLGLREDRWTLRDACARARAGGVVLVASAPARGGPVFPAAYPGVLAATGDARCAEGEWSLLEYPQGSRGRPGGLLGACPGSRPKGGPDARGGGASYAAARVCGHAAHWIRAQGPALPGADLAARLIEHLAAGATYHGRERHHTEHAA